MAGEPVALYKNDGTNAYRTSSTSALFPTAEDYGWGRDGYTLVNWNAQSDGSGLSFEIGTQIPAGVGAFYAQWVETSVDYIATSTDLTSVANAIRTKAGLSVTLEFPDDFVTAIANIPTGITPTGTKQINISSAGTTTEDVTNYATASISVPTGSVGGGTSSKTVSPNISVNDDGLITAANSSAVYVTPSIVPGFVSSASAEIVTVSGYSTSQLPVYGGNHHPYTPPSTDYTVQISLTYPHNSSSFSACTIYESTAPFERGSQIGSISTANGSTTVTVSATSYGLEVELIGNGYVVPPSDGGTCTGGVSFDNCGDGYSAFVSYEVTGDGTITIPEIDWDD